MGCTESSEVPPPQPASTARPAQYDNPYGTPSNKTKQDPQEVIQSADIERKLERAKHEEELKVKLLLLGAGESGKSTIFKQMRILYGSPRSEDDLRMYGVVVRSNVITAMRKLCAHLRGLNLEEQLAGEPIAGDANGTNMSPKQAYDLIVSHLVDLTAEVEDLEMPVTANGDAKDWVGQSPRAGLASNNDAKQFLQLWRYIKTLWEVRRLNVGRARWVVCFIGSSVRVSCVFHAYFQYSFGRIPLLLI